MVEQRDLLVAYHVKPDGSVITWIHEPIFRQSESTYRKGEWIIDINSPISYYINDLLKDPFQCEDLNRFGIDAGGRNYGVDGTVWLEYDKLRKLCERKLQELVDA